MTFLRMLAALMSSALRAKIIVACLIESALVNDDEEVYLHVKIEKGEAEVTDSDAESIKRATEKSQAAVREALDRAEKEAAQKRLEENR